MGDVLPDLSIFLAGDAIIVRPWSAASEPAFLDLVARMRAADVTIANLETVIHEFGDYAQADSGGAWMASPPAIAAELKWAGIDMLAHANNHAFDYGPGALLETHRHAAAAGLIVAGSGADLQAARAPRTLKRAGGSVALVAAASTFTHYGRASHGRPDMHGRPGLNPLTLRADSILQVPRTLHRALRTFDRLLGHRASKHVKPRFGMRVAKAAGFGIERGLRARREDQDANLAAIRLAETQADLVVFSLHAHRQGRWLQDFARQAIEAGAAIVFVHGPHEVRGIELYRGRPIFYGLGDFVFEPHCVERFPAEAYEGYRLPTDAGPEEVRARQRGSALSTDRATFEGCAAALRFSRRRLAELSLLPLDLGFDLGPEARGRPQLADPALGGRIVARIAALSAPYGTRIEYDAARNEGVTAMAG